MLKKIVQSRATLCLLIFVFVAVSHGQVCEPAAVGLISWWPADGNALEPRSRNNGILQNGASLSAGHVGQAFSLDGVNDFVDVPNTAALNPMAQVTIEAWINPTSAIGGRRIVDKITAGGSDGYVLQINNRRLNFIVGTQNLIGLTTINENTWTHVVGTYDGTATRIYINGVLEGELAGVTTVPSNAFNLHIGADSVGGSNFQGFIDEPSIYNRALSAAETAAIHAAGPAGKCKPSVTVAPSGQVGWWAGDGNANDRAGTNNGTLQNGATLAVGKVGQSFNLDGANDFVSLGNPAILKFTNTSFTVEGWFLAPDVPNNPGTQCGARYPIFGFDFGYTIELGGDGRLRFRKFVNQNDSFSMDSLSPLSTNTFHHFAAIHTPTEMRLFVDGLLVNTLPIPDGTVFYIGGDVPEIGRFDCGQLGVTAFFFKGKIDETSVYQRALSALEIQSIFNAGIGGKLKETSTTGTTATVGDVTVTYSAAATRRTHQIPLEEADMPALPAGMTATGLLYDIATDVMPSGTTDLCFNLQAFAALTNAEFLERRILHLESGAWINRTISRNFATKTICAQVLSFSPFAIVDSNIAPTAASVSVGGRVSTADGRGISRAVVSIADPAGNTQTALTNPFGYFKFNEVEAGATYLVSVDAKQYQFENPIRTVNVIEELVDVNFMAMPPGQKSTQVSRGIRQDSF